MRKINQIIIHCSANERYSGATFDSIKQYHIKERGYKDIGYHFVVDDKGTIYSGRPVAQSGAHCKGHNAHSIGICYIGGLSNGFPCDTRTVPQSQSLHQLISQLCNNYPIKSIVGHKVYNRFKFCPCFDAKKEYSHLIQKGGVDNE